MGIFLTNLILAVRNNGAEEWTNLLFLVVLAVFWAIGGILKAWAQKANMQRKGGAEQPTTGSGGAGSAAAREREASSSIGQRLAAKSRPRSAAVFGNGTRVSAEPARRRAASSVRPAVKSSVLSTPMEQARPPRPSKPLANASSKPLLSKRRLDSTGPSAAPEAHPVLPYLNNPQSLREAIIYLEVLGKPVSLRDPAERTGFY